MFLSFLLLGLSLFIIIISLIVATEGLVAIVIILIVAIIIFYAYRKHEMYNSEIQKNTHLQVEKNKVMPWVIKYCNSIARSWGNWPPENLQYNESDFEALQNIIFQETGHIIEIEHLWCMIREALFDKATDKFSCTMKSIIAEKGLDLNEKDILETYVDIFPKYSYSECYLLTFSLKNIDGFDETRFSKKLCDAYNSKALSYRTNHLLTILNSEDAIHKVISISDIDKMSGIEFEHVLYELFKNIGYSTKLTKASGDQGADLLLEKHGRTVVVQAKRYSGKLGNTPIQEVVAAKLFYNCMEAMVITNSIFTDGAINLANANNVELIDRYELESLLREYPIQVMLS